jgi:uncharacterized membrane protein YphA (DoxX/SURF4 family)
MMSAGVGAVILIGRVLFSIFFVTSGWGHLTKGKGMIGYAETSGLPAPYLAGWPSACGCSPPQRPSPLESGPTSGF